MNESHQTPPVANPNETLFRDFDIYRPATEDCAAEKVKTIQVEVTFDEDGEEVLTSESLQRVEREQARARGLMFGEDIRALRERLCLTQKQLAGLIGCAEKSIPRWENGNACPTGTVNKMLRLLDEGFLHPASLNAVVGPRRRNAAYTPTMPMDLKPAPFRVVGSRHITVTEIYRSRMEILGERSTVLAEELREENVVPFEMAS